MEKDIIPHEQVLILKEIGFDEPCFGYYDEDKYFFTVREQDDIDDDWIQAPIYSQAFRWFREKHNLYPIIDLFVGVKGVLKFFYKLPMHSETFNTYEEAELACLIKLIEIVKNKLG